MSNKPKNILNKEQQKKDFLQIFSHELKTPLTPLMLSANMLKNEKVFGALNPKQRKAVKTINDCTDELNELIRNIFYANKIDSNEIKYTMKEIRIDEIMNNVFDSTKNNIQKNNITFENTTKDTGIIHGDPKIISQVLKYIINNALSFVTPNSGKIEINASIKEKQVIFYVRDNGIGISEDDKQNLFTRFYQQDTSLSRKHNGIGLSLSICHGLITGMNGDIWFESEIGKGSIFYFSLPKFEFHEIFNPAFIDI